MAGVGLAGFSEAYNKSLYALKTIALNRVLEKHRVDVHGKSVLDIGCGTGFFTEYYRSRGARRICGVDITHVSVIRLRQKYPDCVFEIADIGGESKPFDETFHVVNVFDVLYHIIDDVRFENAMRNISALTRHGGWIVITDVFGERDSSPAEHVRFRSLEKYRRTFVRNALDRLGIFPLYYLMNRRLLLPPRLVSRFGLPLSLVDRMLQKLGVINGGNVKLLIARKREHDSKTTE